MSPSRDQREGPVVGVDAGGTWVRVRAMADMRRVASLTHPASAVPELATFLHTVWRRRGWTRTQVDALVVAARGVWLPRERRALRRRLAGLARRVDVIADVEAAWHATLGAERGVLVLAGTGSIALGRDARGRWQRDGRSLVRRRRAPGARPRRCARALARVGRRAGGRRGPPGRLARRAPAMTPRASRPGHPRHDPGARRPLQITPARRLVV